MDLRASACFALSRMLMRPPNERTIEYSTYSNWRSDHLAKSWSSFSDDHISRKDVLDFGCGDGPLSLFLAENKNPRRLVGVDLSEDAIARARDNLQLTPLRDDVEVTFLIGAADALPVPDCSFDTLLAFDCLEHVMSLGPILSDWHRVLRPGGRCLVEWFPYKGPWGPHMESLIPIPWAHVLFGERAMLRAAERIYDLEEFIPRHWDLDAEGHKKPNKWRAWSTFTDQGYINKLDIPTFRDLAQANGFRIARLEMHSFGGSRLRRKLGRALMSLPLIGEYFVSYAVIELVR